VNTGQGPFEDFEMILRSAFWLTVGFMVMAPHGTDFAAIASNAKDQAIGAGTQAAEQIIVSQVLTNTSVAKAMVRKLSTPSPSADLPMQDLPAPSFVFPRSRPATMG
jgi:hypothetical protein